MGWGEGRGEVSCALVPPGKEAPGTPLGIIRLVFAEAAAHASSLIRFIMFLTGWMCSSRSQPFGELISFAYITVSGFVSGGGLKGGSGFLCFPCHPTSLGILIVG